MNNYYTGKSVDEAVQNALDALGITKEQADITVIEEATKGIFGIGGKPAKVLVTKKQTEEDKTVAFLEGLFNVLNVAVSIDVTRNAEEKTVFNLLTANSSVVIGYRGEVLDAVQTLAGAVYNSDKEDYSRVVVDCENYREKREKTLIALADKLANKAIKTGRKVTLEPMNPFERRIIHAALTDFVGVKTQSEGKEPNRYVAIIPDGYDPSKERYKKGGFDRKGKGGKHFNKPDRPKASKEKKPFGTVTFLGNSLKDKE